MISVREIRFWKRDSNCIENIIETIILPKDKSFILKKQDEEREFTKEEMKALTHTLFQEYEIDKDTDYVSYKFENDRSNLEIKFFLTIDFTDKTYLCYRGIKPFRQKHYHDIIALFD